MRYKSASLAEPGDRVIFDNSGGFAKELPRTRIVGEVVELERTGENINDVRVRFSPKEYGEPIEINLPYYILM